MTLRLGNLLRVGRALVTVHDVILGSANLSYHFNRLAPQREEWDPFLVGGVSAARNSGAGGLYLNLGARRELLAGPPLGAGVSSKGSRAGRILAASPNSGSVSLSGRKVGIFRYAETVDVHFEQGVHADAVWSKNPIALKTQDDLAFITL
jgi:hypothetical protein